MRLYRLLLHLFPAAFRMRFGDDMADLFDDRLRAARSRGAGAAARLWIRAVLDLIAHAAAERRTARRHPNGSGVRMAFRSWFTDLGAAVRSLTRRPGFALATAFTLALGLGFNTALFAVVYNVMLKPLPFPEPDRIVLVWSGRGDDGRGFVNSVPDYQDWRDRAQSFSGLAVYNITWTTLAERTEPEEVGGAVVSANFFDVLGARFQLGRGFEAGADRQGAEPAVILTDSLWRRQYGADPAIVGRLITIDGRARKVAGVLTADYRHPEPFWEEPAEFFRPFILGQQQYGRGFRWVRVIGRLAPGATIASAQAEMETIAGDLARQFPATNDGRVTLAGLHQELVGQVRPMLLALVLIVGAVLTLACANIVNVLLARASGRSAEFAIRSALGAGRMRILRQLMFESLILGLAGGAAGIAVAAGGVRLVHAIGPSDLPRLDQIAISGEVLLFAFATAIAAGLLCGLIPAVRAARAERIGALRETRGSAGPQATRRRTWLIAAEMALAVPLLVGALLLTRTLLQLQAVDKGFDASGVVQARVTLEDDRYDDPQVRVTFFRTLADRIAAMPGVRAAGITSSLPLSGINVTGGTVTGERADGTAGEAFGGYRLVSPGYVEAMNIRLVRGRAFSGSETGVALVSDRLAQSIWNGEDPIGRRVRQGTLDSAPQDWFTVVGVVTSVRQTSLTEDPAPELFLPYATNPWRTMTIVARTEGSPSAMLQPFAAAIRGADRSLALTDLATLQDVVDRDLSQTRFGVLCAIAFGALGIALAAVGTFAVLSLLVAARTREIGIRVALGAAPARVLGDVLRDAMMPALAGCAAGAVLALWAARSLESLLYGVTPSDAGTIAGAALLLAAVALAAAWLPARRAMQVDPLRALRSD